MTLPGVTPALAPVPVRESVESAAPTTLPPELTRRFVRIVIDPTCTVTVSLLRVTFCDACDAELREVLVQPYVPGYDPHGNDTHLAA